MQVQDTLTLYDYNYWATRRILTACAKITPEHWGAPTSHSWGSLRGTLVHLLDTEISWRTMCQTGNFTPDLNPADFPNLAVLEQRWKEEEQAWYAYLRGLRDEELTRIVRYSTPSGIVRERLLWHVLFHVVNHGMQHRSEAAAMLTDYGQSPGDIDFTLFLNESPH